MLPGEMETLSKEAEVAAASFSELNLPHNTPPFAVEGQAVGRPSRGTSARQPLTFCWERLNGLSFGP